ncbi:hypothetical protein SUGI_0041650 [Cryptomeria japonica]|nr:hypothetical protein SUGI_0041650 [Cryptomeria japonica]
MIHLIRALGVIGLESRRVACNYLGYNIWFKINKSSNYPYYLSLVLLYQGGESDIVAVEVSEEGISDWKEMWRRNGGVWVIVMPSPKGNIIPSSWKAGVLYESGIQLEY